MSTTDNDVNIEWQKIGALTYEWHQLCADVVEVFGLPGDRFTSHPSVDYMRFTFKNKKDADLCKILLSDRI
jgi:hypothetical protein